MTYRELQAKLKEYKAQGVTSIRLNAPKEQLENELRRLEALTADLPEKPESNTVTFEDKGHYTFVNVCTADNKEIWFQVSKKIATEEKDIINYLIDKTETLKQQDKDFLATAFNNRQEEFIRDNIENRDNILSTLRVARVKLYTAQDKKLTERLEAEKQLEDCGVKAFYGGTKGHGFWLKDIINPRTNTTWHSIAETKVIIADCMVDQELIADGIDINQDYITPDKEFLISDDNNDILEKVTEDLRELDTVIARLNQQFEEIDNICDELDLSTMTTLIG